MELYFNSLTFFGRMKEAGMPDAQAKAQAEAMQEAFASYHASLRMELATKADLAVALANAKHDILRWTAGVAIAQTALIVAIFGMMTK